MVAENLGTIENVAKSLIKLCKLDKGHYEDLVQEGCLAACKAMKKFDPARGSANALIYRSARYGMLKYLKSLPPASADLPKQMAEPTNAREEDSPKMTGNVGDLLSKLPKRYREILERIYLKGESQTDIARSWGVTKQSVEQMRDRALAMIREAA